MKKLILTLVVSGLILSLRSQNVERSYYFSDYQISHTGSYTLINFSNTRLTGFPGEPVLPWHTVTLLLPPGEIAASIEVTGEEEQIIPGTYTLYPQQQVRPLSEGSSGTFIRNQEVYRKDAPYPSKRSGMLTTQFLNGYALALCSFTPVTYNPSQGSLTYFRKVTVRITTTPDPSAEQALQNLPVNPRAKQRLQHVVQNPAMAVFYPDKPALKTGYQMLIITPASFGNSYPSLIGLYQGEGIDCQVVTTQFINGNMNGQDLQEKIRNFIIQEYQANGVEFVLLGGDAELVPYRGFYCQVQSAFIYEDSNIPADLYYSALDGTWDDNGNNLWGEPGEDDLLPDIAVTRFPFSTEQELQNMIHKTVAYQANPVPGEMKQPLLVGEHLYDDPMTFGGPYLDLLIDDQNANGYFTHGIPSSENTITRLYDTLISLPNNIFHWEVTTLLQEINLGKSFIHHAGHSNEMYMMRLFIWDITNQNFSQVNGVDHNYTLMYTHGCLCGAFDVTDCIAEKAVTIENFLAGGVFNSRYGWFNEGQTEGPSAHLNREFVSALYNDTISFPRIGQTHMMSKIYTAPWVTAPGQWEPGALRWCFYCCNVFGDPAMEIWTDNPPVGLPGFTESLSLNVFPNPSTGGRITVGIGPPCSGEVRMMLLNSLGQVVWKQSYLTESQGDYTVVLQVPEIRPGLYTLKVHTANLTGLKKVMVF